MTNVEMLLMLIALTLGTQLCRFIPWVMPKSLLAHPLLQKLNRILPLVIMLLLVFTSLSIPKSDDGYPLFTAQLIALVSVILSYKWFSNILLSVGIGILSLNVGLWAINTYLF